MSPKARKVVLSLLLFFPLFIGSGESLRASPKKGDELKSTFSNVPSPKDSTVKINYKYPEQRLLKTIIELGISGESKEALALATEYYQKHKGHPCGPFALGIVHEWIIETQIPEPHLGPAINVFEEAGGLNPIRIEKDTHFDAPASVCRGAALIRLSRIYYKYGQMIPALHKAIAGGKELKHLSKVAPDAYDLYTFLGPYYYFTDRSPAPAKFLMRIFGLKGDRKKGLRQLNFTWDKAPLFRADAGQVLYTIGTKHEGQYMKYQPIIEQLIATYPNNLIYQRLYSKAQRQTLQNYPIHLPEK